MLGNLTRPEEQKYSIAQLQEILGVFPLNVNQTNLQLGVTGISTDSRSLRPGEVFLALRGENFDGHKFVRKAQEMGAIGAIVEKDFLTNDSASENWHNFPLFLVENTLIAYQAIALWWRQQWQIPIIAVTGSVGKTTTKELISAVLNTQGNVLKTQLNFNNEIGVPKTLLEINNTHNFAVIEMGMRGPGEIAVLSQITQPTIAVITNVGTAHIGRLGSEEAIALAKCELLAEMPPQSIAVLNYDNNRLINTARQIWQGKTVTYGLTGGDIQGQIIDQKMLRVGGFDLPLPLAGEHHALNYLAALAVAQILGINWQPLTKGLTLELPEGRAQRYHLANDIVILDESYNAGLESMLASLKLLAQTPGKRHIAVLGTMKELGDRSDEFHQQVGEAAKQLNIDALFIFADRDAAAAMAKGATGLPLVEIADLTVEKPHDQLARRLKNFQQTGDRILFKASHSVQLNKVIEHYLSN